MVMHSSMKVLFLGTSGSWPSPERNVPAVALKVGGEIILFDCGEGTQRQFMKSQFSFMQVSKIIVSHLHGDHFLGINGLAQTMSLNCRKEPLDIFGPEGTSDMIERFLGLGYFNPSFEIRVSDISDGWRIESKGYSIQARKSEHIIPSLAYAVEEIPRRGKFNREAAIKLGVPEGKLFQKLQIGENIEVDGRIITSDMVMGPPRRGRKVVYSGDTRPCDNVLELARDSDLLIHDGTVDSSFEEKINGFGHSSVRQAAEIAKKAKARTLAIVHISPRYENADDLIKEARQIFENTIIPEDLFVYEVENPD